MERDLSKEPLPVLLAEIKRLQEIECSRCRDEECDIHFPLGTLKPGLGNFQQQIDTLKEEIKMLNEILTNRCKHFAELNALKESNRKLITAIKNLNHLCE